MGIIEILTIRRGSDAIKYNQEPDMPVHMFHQLVVLVVDDLRLTVFFDARNRLLLGLTENWSFLLTLETSPRSGSLRCLKDLRTKGDVSSERTVRQIGIGSLQSPHLAPDISGFSCA